jgi:hypothetical protein
MTSAIGNIDSDDFQILHKGTLIQSDWITLTKHNRVPQGPLNENRVPLYLLLEVCDIHWKSHSDNQI